MQLVKQVFNTIIFMFSVSTVVIPILYYLKTGKDYILHGGGKF